MKELFPEAYGLQQEELAAAAILKQYVMDNGISELAQAFDGNTVNAAKLVHLIEKAKPHALAAIRQSSLNTEVETRLEQAIESVKLSEFCKASLASSPISCWRCNTVRRSAHPAHHCQPASKRSVRHPLPCLSAC